MVDSPPPVVLAPFNRPRKERVLTGPAELYLRGNESLRLTSWNSLTGVQLALQGRFLTSENVWSELRELHTPNTDRSAKTQVYQVAGSLISNLVLFAVAGAPLVGQTFVKLELIMGDGTAATVLGVVLQGYVTNNVALAWPGSPVVNSLDGGGYLRSFTGTNPGLGNNINEICPTGARWELLTVHSDFSASATVGDRQVVLEVNAAGPVPMMSSAPGVTVPSTVDLYCWNAGMSHDVRFNTSLLQQGIPVGTRLNAGHSIRTIVGNMAADDQFVNPAFSMREWIVP